MDNRPAPSLADSVAAAIAWWRDAGVDCSFTEEPQAWLADPAEERESETAAPVRKPAKEAEPAAPAIPRIGGDRADWPSEVAAFRQWWLEEPSLDLNAPHPRIAPRGEAGAPLMVLVPMPEEEDREALLSGAQGRLVASMAQAMGHSAEAVYLAAALPRHMAVPDWAGLAEAGLGEILRHHIALARPERLIVLGRSIPPLIGHDPAQGTPHAFEIPIDSGAIPALASYAPERLLQQPRLRAGLWRRWLDWTGDGAQ